LEERERRGREVRTGKRRREGEREMRSGRNAPTFWAKFTPVAVSK